MTMNQTGFLLFFVGAFVGVAAPASAGPPEDFGPPPDAQILVQSELDLLPAAKRILTLHVKDAQPADVLETLRKHSGLAIGVQGTLPAHPVLSASFRDKKLKDVLNWFAEAVSVTFRAEPPSKLWIVVETPKAPPRASEAS